MAVFEDNLLQVQEITSVLTSLCDLAERECWDDLLLAWPSYEQATVNLPQINWDELSIVDREFLQNKLLHLQMLHRILNEKMMVFRAELKDVLQNSIQSRKLNDAYR